MIDLDALLYGTPTWKQVVEFWKHGDFCEERYTVQAIEKHLLTEDQRKRMFDMRLSIEKMLNGRHGNLESSTVDAIFEEWNTKLGFREFGF